MLFKLLILLISSLFLQATAQNNSYKKYRVPEGLPGDIIKGINQDSLGYFWIASDDGLVKYDGVDFTTYKTAFKSKFVKAFLKTKNNKLLAIADLGVIEINNQIDTVKFKTLIDGGYKISDSTVMYPKAIFQDSKEFLWIAEPQSVVRYYNSKIKRYTFGREHDSNNFNKSFLFFEDELSNLYLITYNGKVFIYNRLEDVFKKIEGQLPNLVNNVIYINNKLYIASMYGLFTANISPKSVSNLTKSKFPLDLVSCFGLGSDSSFWVGTFGSKLLKYKNYKEIEGNQYEEINFNRINSIYLSNENDFWISSEKGIGLLQNEVFFKPAKEQNHKFINAIFQDKTSKDIYFCNKETLSKLFKNQNGEFELKDILNIPEGNFQTLATNDKGLWACNSDKLLLLKNDILIKTISLKNEGNQIFDIINDSKNNIWVAQSRSNTITKVNNDFTIERFKLNEDLKGDFRLVTEGSNGIYASTVGSSEQYLFYKPYNKNVFENISVPLEFNIVGDFEIIKMAEHKKILWLATSNGLLKMSNNKLERIDLGEKFTDLSMNSLAILDDENLIFGNNFGLFRYNISSKEYFVYDENQGLPSNTISDHGIFLDSQKQVWLGTSHGVASAKISNLLNTKPTITPYCVSAKVDGKPVKFNKGIIASYEAFINLKFSSITFPENSVFMQYKLLNEKSEWIDIENSELAISNLGNGTYELLVRSKKHAGESWSEPASMLISIQKPFWKEANFILLISIAIIGLVWILYLLVSFINNQRRENLQKLVRLRTKDLEAANQELNQKNIELDRFVYSASHDLGAPLKSLLGLISIAKMEETREAIDHYHILMEKSVKKLDEFIKEVISYSRNSRTTVEIVLLNFKELVIDILEDHKYAENYELITFNIDDKLGEKLKCDKSRIKIILNNLISNAIKFHNTNGTDKPFVNINISKNRYEYILTVEDNGRGIPKEHQTAIFDMFYRASLDVQGSGLGLYILKETITKLKGNVVVESQMGKGTKFTIKIPIPSGNVQNLQ